MEFDMRRKWLLRMFFLFVDASDVEQIGRRLCKCQSSTAYRPNVRISLQFSKSEYFKIHLGSQ